MHVNPGLFAPVTTRQGFPMCRWHRSYLHALACPLTAMSRKKKTCLGALRFAVNTVAICTNEIQVGQVSIEVRSARLRRRPWRQRTRKGVGVIWTCRTFKERATSWRSYKLKLCNLKDSKRCKERSLRSLHLLSFLIMNQG